MTNKEVVDDLLHIQQLLHLLEGSKRIVDATIYDEVIQQAIKCVELMPELVEALEEAREFLVDADGEGYYYWEDEIKKYGELIKKAKGKSDDRI